MAAEKNFENRLRAWLHTVGVYSAGMPNDKQTDPPKGWYLKIWGGGFQKSGIPDLLMCVNGIFIAAECVKVSNRKAYIKVELKGGK